MYCFILGYKKSQHRNRDLGIQTASLLRRGLWALGGGTLDEPKDACAGGYQTAGVSEVLVIHK